MSTLPVPVVPVQPKRLGGQPHDPRVIVQPHHHRAFQPALIDVLAGRGSPPPAAEAPLPAVDRKAPGRRGQLKPPLPTRRQRLATPLPVLLDVLDLNTNRPTLSRCQPCEPERDSNPPAHPCRFSNGSWRTRSPLTCSSPTSMRPRMANLSHRSYGSLERDARAWWHATNERLIGIAVWTTGSETRSARRRLPTAIAG
jgi:hypothetical protein